MYAYLRILCSHALVREPAIVYNSGWVLDAACATVFSLLPQGQRETYTGKFCTDLWAVGRGLWLWDPADNRSIHIEGIHLSERGIPDRYVIVTIVKFRIRGQLCCEASNDGLMQISMTQQRMWPCKSPGLLLIGTPRLLTRRTRFTWILLKQSTYWCRKMVNHNLCCAGLQRAWMPNRVASSSSCGLLMRLLLYILPFSAHFISYPGSVLRTDVEGRVLMKAFLSGMPECCLGFNMAGEDCTFSTIVRQHDWESKKSISFVPPDNGNKSEFEIMRYRISDQISVPFKVIPNIVESGRTRCSVRSSLNVCVESG